MENPHRNKMRWIPASYSGDNLQFKQQTVMGLLTLEINCQLTKVTNCFPLVKLSLCSRSRPSPLLSRRTLIIEGGQDSAILCMIFKVITSKYGCPGSAGKRSEEHTSELQSRG